MYKRNLKEKGRTHVDETSDVALDRGAAEHEIDLVIGVACRL
jgi:hypothetical protein